MVDQLLAEISQQQDRLICSITVTNDEDAITPLRSQLSALAQWKRKLQEERQTVLDQLRAGMLALSVRAPTCDMWSHIACMFPTGLVHASATGFSDQQRLMLSAR